MRSLKPVKRGNVKLAQHDPAPSRFQFRVQRWLLTPGFRFCLKVGLPALMVITAVSLFFASQERRDALTVFVAEIRASIEERPEFMVNLMAIDGANPGLAEDVREILSIDFPISSFDLDLDQIRGRIEGLDPVRSASVRIRPGGILQVDVTERVPVVVWRTFDGLEVLDETGVHVGEIAARAVRADLPLIAGKGADRAVPQALELFAAGEDLDDRLRGLMRVGERRWDVLLDRDQRILLPTDNPVQALERVIALSEAKDLFERDVVAVDMRLTARPTVRMSEAARENWWKIRHLDGGGQ